MALSLQQASAPSPPPLSSLLTTEASLHGLPEAALALHRQALCFRTPCRTLPSVHYFLWRGSYRPGRDPRSFSRRSKEAIPPRVLCPYAWSVGDLDTVGLDPIRTPGPMELLPAHPHVLLPTSEPLFLDGGVGAARPVRLSLKDRAVHRSRTP